MKTKHLQDTHTFNHNNIIYTVTCPTSISKEEAFIRSIGFKLYNVEKCRAAIKTYFNLLDHDQILISVKTLYNKKKQLSKLIAHQRVYIISQNSTSDLSTNTSTISPSTESSSSSSSSSLIVITQKKDRSLEYQQCKKIRYKNRKDRMRANWLNFCRTGTHNMIRANTVIGTLMAGCTSKQAYNKFTKLSNTCYKQLIVKSRYCKRAKFPSSKHVYKIHNDLIHQSSSGISSSNVIKKIRTIGRKRFLQTKLYQQQEVCTISHINILGSNITSFNIKQSNNFVIESIKHILQDLNINDISIETGLEKTHKHLAYARCGFKSSFEMKIAVDYLKERQKFVKLYKKNTTESSENNEKKENKYIHPPEDIFPYYPYEYDWRMFPGYEKTMISSICGDIKEIIHHLIHGGDLFDIWYTNLKTLYNTTNIISTYELSMIIWFDAAQAQTACKVRLIDPKKLLFSKCTSAVTPLLMYIGGEEMLSQFMNQIVKQLEYLLDNLFAIRNNDDLSAKANAPIHVKVKPQYIVCDHHALSILTQTPAGRSVHRDCLSRHTRADHWPYLIYSGTTNFEVQNHWQIWNKLNHKLQEFKKKEQEATDSTDIPLASMNRQKSILYEAYGAVKHMPLLCVEHNGEIPRLGTMQFIPPSMHNQHSIVMSTIEITLKLIPTDKLSLFQSIYQNACHSNETGLLAVSASQGRHLVTDINNLYFEELLTSELIKPNDKPLVYLTHLVACICQHLNNPRHFESCPRTRFSFRSYMFMYWLIISMHDRSGKSTRNVYMRDLVQHMPAYEEMCANKQENEDEAGLPLVVLNEEAQEQTFNRYRDQQGQSRSKTDLLGEAKSLLYQSFKNKFARQYANHRLDAAKVDFVTPGHFQVGTCIWHYKISNDAKNAKDIKDEKFKAIFYHRNITLFLNELMKLHAQARIARKLSCRCTIDVSDDPCDCSILGPSDYVYKTSNNHLLFLAGKTHKNDNYHPLNTTAKTRLPDQEQPIIYSLCICGTCQIDPLPILSKDPQDPNKYLKTNGKHYYTIGASLCAFYTFQMLRKRLCLHRMLLHPQCLRLLCHIYFSRLVNNVTDKLYFLQHMKNRRGGKLVKRQVDEATKRLATYQSYLTLSAEQLQKQMWPRPKGTTMKTSETFRKALFTQVPFIYSTPIKQKENDQHNKNNDDQDESIIRNDNNNISPFLSSFSSVPLLLSSSSSPDSNNVVDHHKKTITIYARNNIDNNNNNNIDNPIFTWGFITFTEMQYNFIWSHFMMQQLMNQTVLLQEAVNLFDSIYDTIVSKISKLQEKNWEKEEKKKNMEPTRSKSKRRASKKPNDVDAVKKSKITKKTVKKKNGNTISDLTVATEIIEIGTVEAEEIVTSEVNQNAAAKVIEKVKRNVLPDNHKHLTLKQLNAHLVQANKDLADFILEYDNKANSLNMNSEQHYAIFDSGKDNLFLFNSSLYKSTRYIEDTMKQLSQMKEKDFHNYLEMKELDDKE